MAKFRSARSFTEGDVTVEIGQRGHLAAAKVTLAGGGAFILDMTEAESLADALDEAVADFESDPLLWGDGSQ